MQQSRQKDSTLWPYLVESTCLHYLSNFVSADTKILFYGGNTIYIGIFIPQLSIYSPSSSFVKFSIYIMLFIFQLPTVRIPQSANSMSLTIYIGMLILHLSVFIPPSTHSMTLVAYIGLLILHLSVFIPPS